MTVRLRWGATLALLLLLVVPARPAQGKTRYNLWAKEKIRYHHSRVQLDPQNAELRVLLGSAYFADGDNYRAAQQLERAIELDSCSAEAYCNLGVVRQSQSRRQAAAASYRRALELDSTLVEAMAGLGTLLCRSQRHGEGIEYLVRALQIDARRDAARYNLGVAYHRVGDDRRAVEQLEILRQCHFEFPGSAKALSQAYFARGLVLADAQHPRAAVDFYRQSHDLIDNADVYYAEGLAHLQLEDLARAAAAFLRAVELEPHHVPAMHNLATVYELTGRMTEAMAIYTQIVELAPHLATIEAARHATYNETFLMK